MLLLRSLHYFLPPLPQTTSNVDQIVRLGMSIAIPLAGDLLFIQTRPKTRIFTNVRSLPSPNFIRLRIQAILHRLQRPLRRRHYSRRSNPLTVPLPRGTLMLPSQTRLHHKERTSSSVLQHLPVPVAPAATTVARLSAAAKATKLKTPFLFIFLDLNAHNHAGYGMEWGWGWEEMRILVLRTWRVQ